MGGGAVILAAPHHERLSVAAVVLVVVASFCTLVGPGALRIDLRMELEGLELLKALPLPGWQVIAAELAAPALLLFFVEWLLLGCALALGGFGESAWLPEPALRRMILAGGALVLPTVTLAALTMHNAVAVLFPAWSRVEEGQGRGFEAFGQRLLTLLGTAVGVIGGGLPAAFVGLIAARPLLELRGRRGAGRGSRRRQSHPAGGDCGSQCCCSAEPSTGWSWGRKSGRRKRARVRARHCNPAAAFQSAGTGAGGREQAAPAGRRRARGRLDAHRGGVDAGLPWGLGGPTSGS